MFLLLLGVAANGMFRGTAIWILMSCFEGGGAMLVFSILSRCNDTSRDACRLLGLKPEAYFGSALSSTGSSLIDSSAVSISFSSDDDDDDNDEGEESDCCIGGLRIIGSSLTNKLSASWLGENAGISDRVGLKGRLRTMSGTSSSLSSISPGSGEVTEVTTFCLRNRACLMSGTSSSLSKISVSTLVVGVAPEAASCCSLVRGSLGGMSFPSSSLSLPGALLR